MKTITMERVRELDKIWLQECSEFLQLGHLYRGPSPFFIQEKYLDAVDLKGMAIKWKASEDELQTYITLQRYVNSVANYDYENMPSPEYFAGEIGVSLAEFNEYLHSEAKKIHDSRVDEDDDVQGWHSVTAEDWDFRSDLLQDAAI